MSYAAVISLKQTIDRLPTPSQSTLNPVPNSEIKSIYNDICHLQSSLETISPAQSSSKTADALKGRITDLVHKFEDLIESQAQDELLAESEAATLFSEELLKVKQEVSSLTTELVSQQSSDSVAADLVSTIDSEGEKKNVSLDEKQTRKLIELLRSSSDKREIISIVGMAGIGKSTLTKGVFCNELIKRSFDKCLFVRIGPKYELKQFMLLVLDHMGIPVDGMHKKTGKELGVFLYQTLMDRTYLVVLDDVWSSHVWIELKQFFPDCEKYKSRIILTTRLAEIARMASNKEENILKIPLMDEQQSWTLLQKMVFTAEETCPSEFEKIGKKVAKNCEGLPLLIESVAQLLRAEMSMENWSRVAQNVISLILSGDDETPISKSLSLSYKLLPRHLKACFLYMGAFPLHYEIPTSKLLKLWIAEGFIEPKKGKSLEEMAEEYFDDLVSRNLVIVCTRSSSGRAKTCRVHFVIRNLCASEAQNEKFLRVLNKIDDGVQEGTKSQRRLCVHNNTVLGLKQVRSSMESVSGARSLLCVGQQHEHPLQAYLRFRLLRVLDAFTIHFFKFPHEVVQLVKLKYLAITYDGGIPPSISELWNLEVLIVRRYRSIKSSDAPLYLPMGIWKLHKLRHLECMGFDLQDPSTDDSLVLAKLLTLSGVSVYSCTKGVLARIPNIRKLGVWTLGFSGDFTDLCQDLESFKCVVLKRRLPSQVVSPIRHFPDHLKRISLSRCGFRWEDMTYIGKLPNLEALKLQFYAFQGPLWKLVDGEFLKLKFLQLEDLDIQQWGSEEQWEANDSLFPMLKHLLIRHCYKLREFPSEIGELPALELIQLDDCSPSLVASAKKIEIDLEEYANETLKFVISSSWADDKNFTS